MIKLPTITEKEVQDYIKEKKQYDEIMSRMRECAEVNDDYELADFLKIRIGDLRSNQRKLIISTEWIKILAAEKGISPSWIMSGIGKKEL